MTKRGVAPDRIARAVEHADITVRLGGAISGRSTIRAMVCATKPRTAGRWVAGAAAAGFACLAYIYLALPDVRPLRTSNPATTAFMQLRAREARAAGRPVRAVQQWVRYRRISPHLMRAVLVAEDDAFWQHEGVDFEQLQESLELDWARGSFVRGGSTITQQLAKNLYLSPSKNPVRKLRELLIARRLEAELPKSRILELYLERDRVGRWHLRRGGGGAHLLRRRRGARAGASGAARGRDRQPPHDESRASQRAAPSPPADDPAAHGIGHAAAGRATPAPPRTAAGIRRAVNEQHGTSCPQRNNMPSSRSRLRPATANPHAADCWPTEVKTSWRRNRAKTLRNARPSLTAAVRPHTRGAPALILHH